jgi:hypothetical protein
MQAVVAGLADAIERGDRRLLDVEAAILLELDEAGRSVDHLPKRGIESIDFVDYGLTLICRASIHLAVSGD